MKTKKELKEQIIELQINKKDNNYFRVLGYIILIVFVIGVTYQANEIGNLNQENQELKEQINRKWETLIIPSANYSIKYKYIPEKYFLNLECKDNLDIKFNYIDKNITYNMKEFCDRLLK